MDSPLKGSMQTISSLKEDIQFLIWRIETYQLSAHEIETLSDRLSLKYGDLPVETVERIKEELAPQLNELEKCQEVAKSRANSGVVLESV